jgi:cell wall-associated NlpC family hydrolase
MTNVLPDNRGGTFRRTVLVLAVAVALALLLGIGVGSDNADAQDADYVFKRKSDPARTVVTNSNGRWLATFTDDAYAVSLKGPSRIFSEATAAHEVKSSTWVRVLPEPFDGQVDKAWLRRALANRKPDVLRKAMQYIEDAPPIVDGSGLKIAGDANYGPCLDPNQDPCGNRQEGSDFNDYLGVSWTYGSDPDDPDQPEEAQIHSLDCSGYVRMVFGYRSKLPLTLDPDGMAIPRRSFQILDSAPGVVTTPNSGTQVKGPADFAKLAPGDLVFFDADTSLEDGTRIDHVGIYLGRDTGGNRRFISSRKWANGPTLGDFHGNSILNGTGYYAEAFRAVRRL